MEQEDSPYATPEAELLEEDPSKIVLVGDDYLANRFNRLFASMIDGILALFIIVPVIFSYIFTDVYEKIVRSQLADEIFDIVLLFIVHFLLNGYFLITRGQSIGKMLLRVRIVTVDLKHPPPWVFFIRFFAYTLPSLIPLIGNFYWFINVLPILGDEKRCIHDYIARTVVIKVK